MKNRIWITSAMAIGTCITLTGCSSEDQEFTVSQGDVILTITNADEVLQAAESEWNKALEGSKEVYTTTKSSGCYMLPEQEDASLAAYCGPVSFLDGEENSWSIVNLALAQTEDKEATLEVRAGEQGETVSLTPGKVPSIKELLNNKKESPTDEKPADPSPPVASEGIAQGVPEGVKFEDFAKPIEVKLPEGTITVTAHGTAEEILENTSEWNTSRRIAPEGTTFHAFKVNGDMLVETQTSLRVGETVVAVTPERLSSGFVVPVPDGETVSLEATFDGVAQMFDLTAQERTSTDIAQDWYAPVTVTPDESTFSGEVQTPKGPSRWAGSISTVQRTSWVEDNGWADLGKSSWLIINFNEARWQTDANNYAVISSGPPKATLKDAEGVVYQSEAIGGSSFGGGQYILFKVPSGGTGYTLTLESSGNFTDFSGTEIPMSTSVEVKLNVTE